jgi:hypothetical protein
MVICGWTVGDRAPAALQKYTTWHLDGLKGKWNCLFWGREVEEDGVRDAFQAEP